MKYDSDVIYKYTHRLYSRANSIIFTYTFLGVVFGLVAVAIVGEVISTGSSPSFIIAGIVALLFGFLGYRMGTERAFRIKLEAQIALCQVRIEENTRAAAAVIGK